MKRFSRIISAIFFLALLFSSGCLFNTGTVGLRIAPGYEKQVNKVIVNSGENADELRTFLNFYKHKKQRLIAASFLIANIPQCDAVSMSADSLREHIDNAFETREKMVWGKEIPWNIFLHYVVPHRVSQERPERYRRAFYEELSGVIARCSNMYEAALEVNKWCFLKATYKGSSSRDQGPLATIHRGIGRCEEEMILYICAARSVGLPSRQCYTPRWQNSNSNHAWVEVWADGKWYFLGGCEPASVLNSAWFAEPTKRAVVVISTAYGKVKSGNEIVQVAGDTYTTINSTHVYALPCDLYVSVIGFDGKPLAGAKVYASVYNYGTLYPVVSIVCDDKGNGKQVLGKTTVLLTVSHEGHTDYEFVSTNPENPVSATLDLRRDRLPSGKRLLTFGSGPKAVAGKAVSDLSKINFQIDKGAIGKARAAKFAGFRKQIADFFGFKVDDKEEWKKPLYSQLNIAGGNSAEFIRAIASVMPEEKPMVIRYIETMEDKDLLEITSQGIIDDVHFACMAREEMENRGLKYVDEMFVDFVLNNRVFKEPYSSYRPEFVRRFSAYYDNDLMLTVARVNEYTAALSKVPRSSFGNLLTSLDVVRAGAVVDGYDKYDRATAAVGILRSLGIPARYDIELRIVEFFNGKEWIKFFPAKPEALGNVSQLEESDKPVEKFGKLTVQFMLDGKALNSKQHKFGNDFTISYFTKRGYFNSDYPEGQFDDVSNTYKFSIREGKYFLTTGKRNVLGEPEVHLIPFTISETKPVNLVVKLDLDTDSALPIARNLRSIPSLAGKTAGGVDFDLSKALGSSKKVAVVFFDPSSEPCVNMMPIVGDMIARFPNTRFIGVAENGAESTYRSFVAKNCPKLDYIIDADGEIAKLFKAERFPSILILNSDGSIVMWHEGHNLQIENLLLKALK